MKNVDNNILENNDDEKIEDNIKENNIFVYTDNKKNNFNTSTELSEIDISKSIHSITNISKEYIEKNIDKIEENKSYLYKLNEKIIPSFLTKIIDNNKLNVILNKKEKEKKYILENIDNITERLKKITQDIYEDKYRRYTFSIDNKKINLQKGHSYIFFHTLGLDLDAFYTFFEDNLFINGKNCLDLFNKPVFDENILIRNYLNSCSFYTFKNKDLYEKIYFNNSQYLNKKFEIAVFLIDDLNKLSNDKDLITIYFINSSSKRYNINDYFEVLKKNLNITLFDLENEKIEDNLFLIYSYSYCILLRRKLDDSELFIEDNDLKNKLFFLTEIFELLELGEDNKVYFINNIKYSSSYTYYIYFSNFKSIEHDISLFKNYNFQRISIPILISEDILENRKKYITDDFFLDSNYILDSNISL